MDYFEAENRLLAILQSDGAPMFASIKTTAFPETYRAMFGFCAKTNALKTALFDMVKSDNPYAFKALFRCFCEHYLKFMYVWTRFLREARDDVGVEYFAYCGATELKDYARALVAAEQLVGRPVVANVEAVVARLYPKALGVTAEEVEAASARFRYRAILRYLGSQIPGVMTGEQPFLASILPSYALNSSFVHGGPWGDMELYTFGAPAALNECRADASLVFMMTASIVLFTATAVSREFPEHGRVATRVKLLLDWARSQMTSGGDHDR
jgi:hypothetical protein